MWVPKVSVLQGRIIQESSQASLGSLLRSGGEQELARLIVLCLELIPSAGLVNEHTILAE
jgi:hypothetical protein